MAVTNLISSITRTTAYPITQSVTADNNCGMLSLILGSSWTEQMISELPTINIKVFMSDGTELISIDIDMTTLNRETDNPVEPYVIPLYSLPGEFEFSITPLFDNNAIAAHNAQVETGDFGLFTTANGIVDTDPQDYTSLLWTAPTTTFTLDISFDDSNIVAGGGSGGGGGSSTAAQVTYVNTTSGLTATNVQDAIDEVQQNIDNLPEPMVFKGSLGTGGTIDTLPAASEENKGFTYKVITAGTYQGIAAEVGDTLISDGTSWTLIPSGDEPSGTVTNVAVTSTDGSATITGSPITSSGTIDIKVNVDTSYNSSSTKPVTNSLITNTFTPFTQEQYDALTNKDKPIYFIYET